MTTNNTKDILEIYDKVNQEKEEKIKKIIEEHPNLKQMRKNVNTTTNMLNRY
jgi:hypothetical protein